MNIAGWAFDLRLAADEAVALWSRSGCGRISPARYRLQDICGPRVELRGKDCGIV